MHPLDAYSVALITRQADVPTHIQASLASSPMSSMYFFWTPTIISLQKLPSGTVFRFNNTYGGNLLSFVYTQHDSNT
jgi:hypothetical protein